MQQGQWQSPRHRVVAKSACLRFRLRRKLRPLPCSSFQNHTRFAGLGFCFYLRRVQKDCLISYAGSQYSVPAEYVGKDVAVVALDNMLAAYYEGKQIALHRISYQRKDMVVNPQHYRRLTLKQTMDAENVLLEQGKVIDFPLKPSDLSRYDEVLYD